MVASLPFDGGPSGKETPYVRSHDGSGQPRVGEFSRG